MNDLQPHLALRELRTHMTAPATLVAITGVSAILAVAAPFETDETLRLAPRFIYWLIIVVASYATGFLVSEAFSAKRRRWHIAQLTLITGFITGLGVSLIVLIVNYAALGILPATIRWIEFFGAIISISIIVSAVATIIGMSLADAKQSAATNASPADTADTAQVPPLLDRLPFDKRAPLVAISVEDHYVRIYTTKGEDLILLRLSDAIKEIGTTPGAQIHRSHWAAFDHVQSVRREGDRAILTMTNAIEIPASRANMAKIKEAGLLPR